jgi:hypothetical protein
MSDRVLVRIQDNDETGKKIASKILRIFISSTGNSTKTRRTTDLPVSCPFAAGIRRNYAAIIQPPCSTLKSSRSIAIL